MRAPWRETTVARSASSTRHQTASGGGGCHSVGEGARGGFGPELNGIIGRPAGTTTDYQYSDAMKNSGVVWTRDKLAAYIEAPKKVVSGTRMIFWGISDQEKIDNILAYLETFQPK